MCNFARFKSIEILDFTILIILKPKYNNEKDHVFTDGVYNRHNGKC